MIPRDTCRVLSQAKPASSAVSFEVKSAAAATSAPTTTENNPSAMYGLRAPMMSDHVVNELLLGQ